MSADATRLQTMYLQFLQNQIDRTSRAYRRSANGEYGFDEWFRDWTECAADVVGTAWAPWKEILDTQARWRLEVKAGATNVLKAFRCNVPEGTTLEVRPPETEIDAKLAAYVDADGRNVIVHVSQVGDVPPGTASVWRICVGQKTVGMLTLTIT